MNLRAVVPWLLAWWCDRTVHRWTYSVRLTRRRCLRCSKRQWRIDLGGEWQDERRSC